MVFTQRACVYDVIAESKYYNFVNRNIRNDCKMLLKMKPLSLLGVYIPTHFKNLAYPVIEISEVHSLHTVQHNVTQYDNINYF